LSKVYGHVPHSEATDAETGSVELICMCVCILWLGGRSSSETDQIYCTV